jgi:hypothetical protein
MREAVPCTVCAEPAVGLANSQDEPRCLAHLPHGDDSESVLWQRLQAAREQVDLALEHLTVARRLLRSPPP